MRVARVPAQAKVNLWLKVGFADPTTGYHDLNTLFQRIDLADDIVIRAGGSVRSIDCTGPQLPKGGLGPAEKNLAFRAAFAYAERADWLRGFSIEVTKNIPVGGGLGGGSADAGAVLRALDAIAPERLGSLVLQELALALGADVPFLVTDNVTAIGRGRGEKLQPNLPLTPRDVLVVVPSFAVSAADAYRWLDETGHDPPPWSSPQPPIGWWEVEGVSYNDLEFPVEHRHPELGAHRERLSSAGARIARMSGSGSCVFGVFEGAVPNARDLAINALVIPTRTSSRVVQVEVLE